MVAMMKLESMPMIFAIIFLMKALDRIYKISCLKAFSAIRPAVLADQRHKSTTSMVFFSASLFSFNYSNQSLTFTRFTHRYDQPAADFELRNQWLGDSWTTGGYQDRIVGRIGRPPQRAVETFYRGVVNAQLSNSRLRFTSEIPDALNRINLRCDLR